MTSHRSSKPTTSAASRDAEWRPVTERDTHVRTLELEQIEFDLSEEERRAARTKYDEWVLSKAAGRDAGMSKVKQDG